MFKLLAALLLFVAVPSAAAAVEVRYGTAAVIVDACNRPVAVVWVDEGTATVLPFDSRAKSVIYAMLAELRDAGYSLETVQLRDNDRVCL